MRQVLSAVLLVSSLGLMGRSGQPDGEHKVDFGINGHPLLSGAYSKLPLEQQLALLHGLRLTTYRVNVNPSNSDKFDRLSRLIRLAQDDGIRILPVMVLSPKSYSGEESAYLDAKTKMYEFAKEFDGRVAVWELGNEYDLYSVKSGVNGASPDDYDPPKYRIVRGLIRGMLAGLHEGSPSSKSIVETSQHTPTALDTGFLQKLVNDGVSFAVTGYHFYSNTGQVPTGLDGKNALRILHEEFHKPIWITEFDKSESNPTLGPNRDPKEQGIALETAMTEIAADVGRFNVVGADIYELLDEPDLLNKPGVNACQAEFGILKADGEETAASRAALEFLRSYDSRGDRASK